MWINEKKIEKIHRVDRSPQTIVKNWRKNIFQPIFLYWNTYMRAHVSYVKIHYQLSPRTKKLRFHVLKAQSSHIYKRTLLQILFKLLVSSKNFVIFQVAGRQVLPPKLKMYNFFRCICSFFVLFLTKWWITLMSFINPRGFVEILIVWTLNNNNNTMIYWFQYIVLGRSWVEVMEASLYYFLICFIVL